MLLPRANAVLWANEPPLKGISCLHNRMEMEMGRRIGAWQATEGRRRGVDYKVWSLDVPRGIRLVQGSHSPEEDKILVK